jgi:CheY-like chemotaxis protein
MPGSGTGQETNKPHLLVVDDEPAMGVALRRILGRRYDLEHLTSAAEALARIRSGSRYDVILCDLMMPDMTGMELYDALTREFPPLVLRMIFFSGGAFTPAGQSFLSRVPNRRIDKPFEAAILEQVIQETLSSITA